MARPRKFEETRAVEAAMRAFWDAGYEATSTQDLCAATGLGRSSIYNTFASKHDLFEKALLHYTAWRNAQFTELMTGEAPVKEKIRTLLWWSVDPEPADPAGCLVINTLVELAPHDQSVAELLRRDTDLRVQVIRSALETARLRGEIGADKDPLALARFVTATINGLGVAARGGTSRAALESIAKVALDAI
ncbi:TetR/AcrR family transcriptional regulator [Nonomuraea fuscirosea]|uniref:TetR/AcrR family transcriptional regulator n=1 Tax=Nonomuraea fuscirosea TaxID=1291556 RepID=UPI0034486278